MSDDAATHALACPSCAEFARDLDRIESQLELAVNIPVDATMAQRIVLNRKLKAGPSGPAVSL